MVPSLRSILAWHVVAAALYVALLVAFLAWRVGPPARTMIAGTGAVAPRIEALQHAHGELDRAVDAVRRLVNDPARDRRARLAALHALLRGAALPPPDPAIAQLADTLRDAFERSAAQVGAFHDALAAAVAMLDRGQTAEVGGELGRLESLHVAVDNGLALLYPVAGSQLAVWRDALGAAARAAARGLLAWLVLGALFTGLSIYAVRRMMWQPLARLEAGLARVAEGDLTVQLPVERQDELGRLAAHFNNMTRVLRDRAEGQGRFAAAGELLAGVAHEVNNPLMAISAQAELRLTEPDLAADERAVTQHVLRQAQRATKLLRGLLRFVRVGEQRVTAVNLNDVIRSAIDLVSYRFGVDEISIGGRLDPKLPSVVGDAIRLEQVLVNLLSNAVDAVRLTAPPRRLAVDSWVEPDGRVCVAVTDSGPGVSDAIASRLFHPFATTKGQQGTGLGLYISRQLVREAGGDLTLVPQAERGARFAFHLPAGPPAPAPRPSPPRTAALHAAEQPLAGIRILVVDDEELVRTPIVRYLTRCGAVVREAADGLEALERLAAEDVDVIVTDLRMPRLDGAALFARLQVERPELAARTLFLSGDITHLAGRGLAPVRRERVMVKPVELAVLEARIRDLAAGAPPQD